ncbi:hypothetical protein [Streptomyces sp. ISL-43]|nr:hypothetical protein [Streptomyces sp. ISL-43]
MPLPPEPSRWERLRDWLRRFGTPWQAAAAQKPPTPPQSAPKKG